MAALITPARHNAQAKSAYQVGAFPQRPAALPAHANIADANTVAQRPVAMEKGRAMASDQTMPPMIKVVAPSKLAISRNDGLPQRAPMAATHSPVSPRLAH
jgi:hypothetical protein